MEKPVDRADHYYWQFHEGHIGDAREAFRALARDLAERRPALAMPTAEEIAAYRDLFRAELDKRMDTKHTSASPSTEAHAIALRAFVDGRNESRRSAVAIDRNAVIEECAKVAENTPTTLCQNGDFLSERCAKAIRALKNAAPQGLPASREIQTNGDKPATIDGRPAVAAPLTVSTGANCNPPPDCLEDGVCAGYKSLSAELAETGERLAKERQSNVGLVGLLATARRERDEALRSATAIEDKRDAERYRALRHRGVLLTMSEYGPLHRDQLDLRCDEILMATDSRHQKK